MSILTSGLIGLGLVGEAVISPAGISYDFMRPELQMTAILFGIYLYLHAKVPPLLVFDQFLMNGFHRIFHSITRISTSTI
jgi:hypothetical protein